MDGKINKEVLNKTTTKLEDGFDYGVTDASIEPILMKDPGEGDQRVIRHFFFKANPSQKHGSKQDIVRSFQRLIEVSLWGDGLQPVFDQPMELHNRKSVKKISKVLYQALVNSGADFVIQVLAEKRRGVIWSHTNPEPSKL